MKELKDFSMDLFNINNKVAIVTGGTTGLGLAYAYGLAKAGADVVVTNFSGDSSEAMELLESTGKKPLVVECDLTKEADRERLISEVLSNFGKIDILVNNAGNIRRSPLLEFQDKDWNSIIDINLNSVYFLSQRVARLMAKQGSGKIINIASMLSFQGGKFVPSYTASKHAIAGLTKAFCNELAHLNIQVNAIAPGYVTTKNTQPILEDKARYESIENRIPAGRWANPEDIMSAVVFLASSASNYINGAIIPVDGGWLAS